MISDYKGLAVFVAVASTGTFSAAGRQLRLSTSVVSHHISKLEERLGVTLFFRSTRSLSLTPEGQNILGAARRMVIAGDEALDALADHSDKPTGTLRVTMPAFGDNSPVHQSVWAFARAHPLVAITLETSEVQVNLIRDGFDIAIRLGQLRDSTLKSRKVGTFERKLVASPDYLATHPAITTPDDLSQCNFVSLIMLPNTIALQNGTQTVEILQEKIRLEVNSVTAAISAIRAGIGLQVLPTSEVIEDLRQGRLVEVLPDWTPPSAGVYAVWPEIGPQKKLTRRFIDFLVSDSA